MQIERQLNYGNSLLLLFHFTVTSQSRLSLQTATVTQRFWLVFSKCYVTISADELMIFLSSKQFRHVTYRHTMAVFLPICACLVPRETEAANLSSWYSDVMYSSHSHQKIQNKELHNLYSPNTVSSVKSRTTWWVRHAARITNNKWIQSFSREH
jgi:hypothetical protein